MVRGPAQSGPTILPKKMLLEDLVRTCRSQESDVAIREPEHFADGPESRDYRRCHGMAATGERLGMDSSHTTVVTERSASGRYYAR